MQAYNNDVNYAPVTRCVVSLTKTQQFLKPDVLPANPGSDAELLDQWPAATSTPAKIDKESRDQSGPSGRKYRVSLPVGHRGTGRSVQSVALEWRGTLAHQVSCLRCRDMSTSMQTII